VCACRHFYTTSYIDTTELQYYQAAARAANLWAYNITHNSTLFLDRTLRGLNSSMAAFYRKKWTCQVGLTSELARMVLPLAWLVRVWDTPKSRGWLRDVTQMLLSYMHPSGAIQEDPTCFNGAPSNHRAPSSNAAYGTAESTLSQSAADPVTDLMYSFNFAFLGLHEAAAATAPGAGAGDTIDPDHARYAAAASRMASVAVRSQVSVGNPKNTADSSSNTPPAMGTPETLDGAWLRAIDIERWEFYASGSDTGWGPWVAETGHGCSLMMMVLAVRERNSSVWETITQPGPWRDSLNSTIQQQIPIFLQA
jgi:hypothetical protein